MARMSAPIGSGPATAGDLLALIRSGTASTRADIGRLTGLSRTAVGNRLAALLAAGLVVEGEEAPSGGGRPPGTLRFKLFRHGQSVTLSAKDSRASRSFFPPQWTA